MVEKGLENKTFKEDWKEIFKIFLKLKLFRKKRIQLMSIKSFSANIYPRRSFPAVSHEGVV